ncbi:SufE family protein [Brucella intermedia]|uniref:SufE family protein n=1 Tax=Brucella intermedia TaxID=94625 RepID=UPI00224939E2|nr:SufE family protein [Brucella intermedia]
MTVSHASIQEAIPERQQRLIDEFLLFDDWAERYQYLIDLGDGLPPMSSAFRVDRYRVPGCAGEAFLAAESLDGQLFLHAASDMPVVAGLLAVMLRLYSGARPADILRHPPWLFDRLGLTHRLSPHRRIALLAVHERLVALASDLGTMARLAS